MNQRPMIDFRFCQPQDVKSVCDLLRSSNLPYTDFDLDKINVIIAIDNKDIIGSIGVELYPPNALLRSFVLRPEYRGKGIASNMFRYLMSYGREKGIRDIHLLTDTADSYFISNGFIIANKNDAPSQIRETSEFKDLCPSTSTYMVKRDIQDETKAFHSNLHHCQTDE
jgi:amino-acid N-acetyltransferase